MPVSACDKRDRDRDGGREAAPHHGTDSVAATTMPHLTRTLNKNPENLRDSERFSPLCSLTVVFSELQVLTRNGEGTDRNGITDANI
jgi:hypothetical protein